MESNPREGEQITGLRGSSKVLLGKHRHNEDSGRREGGEASSSEDVEETMAKRRPGG